MDQSELKLKVTESAVSVVLLCFRFFLLEITNLKLCLILIPPLTKNEFVCLSKTDMTNLFLSL